MCRKLIFLLLLLAFGLTASAQATTVIWVSDNKTPTGGVPADQGWVNLLVDEGYDVDYTNVTVNTGYWNNIDAIPAKLTALNAADLIIVSRDLNSGSYTSNATEMLRWNTDITKPVLCLMAHMARSNAALDRWRWLSTTTQHDATPTLQAVATGHPIFSGVTLDASNQVNILTSNSSISNATSAGNGTLIATQAGTGAQVWIAEWPTGVEFYTGSGYTTGGPRMLLCAGGIGPDGRYNLNAQGEKMFLNAAAYLSGHVRRMVTIPDPDDGANVPPTGKVPGGVYMLMQFRPGITATSHTAYFSADFDDVNDRNPAVNLGSPPYPDMYPTGYYVGINAPEIPAFARVPLTTGKTYYWAVDESDGVSTFPSKVWSFMIVPEQAWDPRPADGDLVIADPNVALTWKLGSIIIPTGYNVSYDVYYGTSFADVNTSTTPTVRVTATTTTTAPLASQTLYYWRVDTRLTETTPPPPFDFTITKGDVWSFTTAPKHTGSILREWWLGINGGGIVNLLNYARYPDHPHGAALLGLFEGPSTWADNYGSRYQGWLLVQKTGDYTFWIATDDNGQLFLSTDEDPANAVMITQIIDDDGTGPKNGYAGARAWDDVDVIPATIHLEGGNAYYISALHKEGTGGDNAAVAWQGPDSGNVREVIPGTHLVPYMPKAISPSPADGAKNLLLAGTMLSWTPGFDIATFNDYASQRVYFGTDAAAVANAGVTSPEYKGAPTGTNSYWPVSLAYYKQYFWRIDGVTGGGQAVKGTVWSFTAIYDASQIVDPNLVGWWKLDGDADDSSGYGNHGVENGSPLYVDAVDDLGIDFDGANDYINCGNSPVLNMNTNITVACWMKGPLGPGWSPFVSKRGEDGMGWKLRRQGSTNNACFTLRGTSGADDQQGNININDNEWHHVAGTYDGAQRNLYVDGQLDTGGSLAETGAIPAAPSDDVIIGAFSRAGQSPSVQTYTNATIDDARVYNRVLTLEQIAQVMRINLAWAWNPSPKNGATGVSIEPVLSWTPGDYAPGANGHYVWFGADDPANMLRSGPRTSNNYTPSALDLDRTYYWVVDEVNAAASGGVDAGRIWSFTTANNKVVDNFETYEDEQTVPVPLDVNWIYFVYTDGFGDLACTAGTGNGSGAKIALQRPGQGGSSLAMTFQYDNDGMVKTPSACNPLEPEVQRAYYSKAEAQVSNLPSGIGSDWTIGGAKSLSLQFYGDPLNSIEPMWVQLTDASNNKATVLYGKYADEDTTYMNDPNWHEWLIDLEDFNVPPTPVNVKNVKSIAIGIGNEAGPAGGSGTLYFDDIRLYAPRCILVRREADFAPFDYVSDCRVDYRELERMADQWLLGKEPEVAWAPFGTWSHNDIGSTATAGGFIDNGDGSYSITGSGADIWGTADAFHYVYKPLVGDGQMTVNVVGVTGTSTNVWQKAGVMIRETLAPGSRNVMMLMSVGPGAASANFAGGDAFQWRPVADQASSSSHVVCDNIEVLMPNCVRLVRTGNMFSGFVYVNGQWVQEGQTVTIAMPQTVYIGLAVTSHDNAAGIYTTATFNSVCDTSFGGLLPELTGDDLVNFTDYAVLMDRFLDEDFFP